MTTLFDMAGPARLPSAPHNGTDTSRAAAASIQGELNKLERLTLRILRDLGTHGATNEEISIASPAYGRYMPVPTVCGRTNRLSELRLIEDSGQRRPGRSGRAAKVWRIREVTP